MNPADARKEGVGERSVGRPKLIAAVGIGCAAST
jgi:hypothetical protein